MKSVNLIPADARKNRGSAPNPLRIPTYVILGLLAASLVLVTVYVLTGNTISSRTAQFDTLQTEVAQTQAQAARLGDYGRFAQLAQQRLQTVSGIAATRFDWHAALADLSDVVPANTAFQSLSGSVAPGASAGGGSGGSSSLRSSLSTPALELTGCTGYPGRRGPPDVPPAPDRRRDPGDSEQQPAGLYPRPRVGRRRRSAGVASCVSNGANFDMVVFFKALPGAGPNGATTISRRRHHQDHARRSIVTARDRIVLVVVLAVAAVAAGWMLVIQPRRAQASKLGSQISSEQTQLDSARAQVAQGEAQRREFAGDYTELARLGEAVPADDDIPSLIYQIQGAANNAHVGFRSLQVAGGVGRFVLVLVLEQRVGESASARGDRRPGRLPDGTVHLHPPGQLLQPVRLLQPPSEVRGGGQEPALDQRAPDVRERDQLRQRSRRLPADHCHRLGHHVPRAALAGPARRCHDRGAGRRDFHDARHQLVPIDPGGSGGRHPGDPMNIVKGIVTELRERRLWPVALALLVGLVAVPVLLTKSPSPAAATSPGAGGRRIDGTHPFGEARRRNDPARPAWPGTGPVHAAGRCPDGHLGHRHDAERRSR